MAGGNIVRNLEFNIIGVIPSFVNLMEVIFGRKQGQTKKAAVMMVLTNLLIVGGSALAMNNPRYADAISKSIDATAQALFPHDEPSIVPIPEPTPGPGWGVPPPLEQPLPPILLPDENTEFDSMDVAISRLHDQFAVVLKKANGKFMIYPRVGPYPLGTTQVYPPSPVEEF